MKFMGSKRWMLRNGLGTLIGEEVKEADRFVDLFSGSGAVSSHVATRYEIPVNSYDLQTFSAVLTGAIIGREDMVDAHTLWASWYSHAREHRNKFRPPSTVKINRPHVKMHREWCASQSLSMTKAYGGHYFSALQAVWLDALRATLPEAEPDRTVALAALVHAASKCAASPGHTAQPFQLTRSAKPYLVSAWQKNILTTCRDVLSEISQQHAKVCGIARVVDANEAAKSTAKGDLVFIDPPYSGVHYSRFYHVLETLARGNCSGVSGVGRYPDPIERPRSKYSVSTESAEALRDLFQIISSRGAKAIVTFPLRQCSNGLSGRSVATLAREFFKVKEYWVTSKFSTMGGNNDHRFARRPTRELILTLRSQ